MSEQFGLCDECGLVGSLFFNGGSLRCAVCSGIEDADDGYEETGEEVAERLDREEEERTCIGAGCLNPHYEHSRWECFTEEDAAQADGDMAPKLRFVRTP